MNYHDLYEISKDFNSLRVWLQEREVFRVNILIIAFYGGCRTHTPAFFIAQTPLGFLWQFDMGLTL